MEKDKRVNHDQGVCVLPYDVLEEILLRLPVKSNIRFKVVSKQWKSTIESRCFAEKHLRLVEQSKHDHPKFLFASTNEQYNVFKTLCLESNPVRVFNLLNIPRRHLIKISESCNGLVCIYADREAYIYVVNPTTSWFRQIPEARFQILMQKATYTRETITDVKPIPLLAFAKAMLSGYKLVWLYNSDIYNSDAMSLNEGFTKCEVFSFRANVWRYLTCTPRYRIFNDQSPVSTNGLVYWLTERYNGETKVIVFDLESETFRLLPKNPVSRSHPDHIDLCILDNRLCMSKRKRRTMMQEIWSLQLSSEETWIKIYTIDLRSCSSWSVSGRVCFAWTRMNVIRPCTPAAILKNKEILLRHRFGNGLVKYDPQTKSYSLMYDHLSCYRVVPYFQSLISHI
ncbi:hypothetical protein CARUB_v10012255mg [Capsella rubella]|uniref:F-box domain-containing protein n=1 Tax=Capsella rubella TaxID=81985 RepID=R0GTX8_9BRAS|nr:putative F-box protein At1g12855 [Capsella rubella]EOA39256.1 hypothetical protein CARUB_v10012255mg [Capsella rubella]